MASRTYILTQRPPRRLSAVAVAVTASPFPLWGAVGQVGQVGRAVGLVSDGWTMGRLVQRVSC